MCLSDLDLLDLGYTMILGQNVYFKGAVSRNSARLGNYKMPVKLRETLK